MFDFYVVPYLYVKRLENIVLKETKTFILSLLLL